MDSENPPIEFAGDVMEDFYVNGPIQEVMFLMRKFIIYAKEMGKYEIFAELENNSHHTQSVREGKYNEKVKSFFSKQTGLNLNPEHTIYLKNFLLKQTMLFLDIQARRSNIKDLLQGHNAYKTNPNKLTDSQTDRIMIKIQALMRRE